MATNTAGTTARQLPWQAIHYLRKGIAYNTGNIAMDATVEVGVIPAGSIVLFTMVRVTTAFNAGTNNPVDVGTSSDDDAYFDGGTTGAGDADGDLTAVGAYISWRGAGVTIPTTDQTIYVTYAQSGTAASAGAAEIIVAYIPDNDQ